MRLIILFLALALTVSCSSNPPTAESKEEMPPIDLSKWGSETIILPPTFAPTLPKGREELLFSPGWPKPDAEDFWTYVILMELEETNIDTKRLNEIFELYFDGLISGVAVGKPFEIPQDPAAVSLHRESATRHTGIIQTYDGFYTGRELTLHAVIDSEPKGDTATILRVQISPQKPDTNRVWNSLRQAIDHVKFK